MVKKFLLIGMFFGFAISLAHAQPYYRFWQGYKLDSLSYDQFRQGLAQEFMPQTVKAGEGKGLVAYLPALPWQHTCLANSICLPDEIALVVYQSEAAYKKLLNDPNWKQYAQLHWHYFSSKGSHSLVPQPLGNKLEINHAYDVLQKNYNWQTGYAVYQVSQITAPPIAYIEFMAAQATAKGLLSYVILVEKSYLIEYQLWQDRNSYQYMAPAIANVRQPYLIPIAGAGGELIKTHINGPVIINYGEGLNFLFS